MNGLLNIFTAEMNPKAVDPSLLDVSGQDAVNGNGENGFGDLLNLTSEILDLAGQNADQDKLPELFPGVDDQFIKNGFPILTKLGQPGNSETAKALSNNLILQGNANGKTDGLILDAIQNSETKAFNEANQLIQKSILSKGEGSVSDRPIVIEIGAENKDSKFNPIANANVQNGLSDELINEIKSGFSLKGDIAEPTTKPEKMIINPNEIEKLTTKLNVEKFEISSDKIGNDNLTRNIDLPKVNVQPKISIAEKGIVENETILSDNKTVRIASGLNPQAELTADAKNVVMPRAEVENNAEPNPKQFAINTEEDDTILVRSDSGNGTKINGHAKSGDNPVEVAAGHKFAETGKFAESAKAIDRDVSNVRFKLIDNIEEMPRNGIKTVQIKMMPDNLGTIRLTLSSHNDSIFGRLIVDNADALHSVESNLNRLIDELSNKGVKLDSFDISLAGGDQGRQFNRRNMMNAGRRGSYQGNSGQSANKELNQITAANRNQYAGASGVNLLA